MMFYQSFRLIQNEKKARSKSKRWAVLFLLLLILLLFFPFITQKMQDEQKVVGILVDFAYDEPEVEEFDNSSSSSAEKSSSRAADESAEEPSDAAPAEAAAANPTPETSPAATSSDVSPLPTLKTSPLTDPVPREINFEKMIQSIPKQAKVETVSEEVVEVSNEGMSKESIDEIAEYFKNSTRGDKKSSGTGEATSSSSNQSDSGNSSTSGEGNSGSSETGDSPTDGKSDRPSDQGVGSSPGEGIDFNGKIDREVIYRANFTGLAKEDGVIVISLCINRDGKVIYAKSNREKSSYKDAATLRNAEMIVRKNRYKRDYTVAERQCGTYTYIIKGVNE